MVLENTIFIGVAMKVKKKVLLIGDFSINRFYYGKTTQIAKDAPITILDITKTEMMLGSSGIVIETLARWGIKPVPLGIVGNDDEAEFMLKKFSELKIPVNRIIKSNEIKTPTISRLIAGSTQIARFDERARVQLGKKITNKLLGLIEKEIKTVALVVICDYAFDTITEAVAKKVIAETQQRNVDLLVSSTGINYLNYKNSHSMIRINTDNSLLLIKEIDSAKISSNKILTKLSEVLKIKKILLTRSNQGIAVYEHGTVVEKPATQDKVIDIKGIGEVMMAAIIYSLLSRNNFLVACELGNIAAGVTASKGDVRLVSKKDIVKAKREYDEWLEQK
jgi:rfaE bifunctional protein kinase chain/domain